MKHKHRLTATIKFLCGISFSWTHGRFLLSKSGNSWKKENLKSKSYIDNMKENHRIENNANTKIEIDSIIFSASNNLKNEN